MIQVWHLNKDDSYSGVSEFINEEEFNEVTMTKIPLLVGYIKARFDGNEWIEGATAEEIQAWELENKAEPQLIELDKLKIAQAEQFEYLLEILEGMI